MIPDLEGWGLGGGDVLSAWWREVGVKVLFGVMLEKSGKKKPRLRTWLKSGKMS